MVYEVADIRIVPGQREAFEEAIQRGVTTVIAKAKGFIDYKIKRCVETPERYLLIIQWATLENHNKDFRESAAFGEWRAIVGPFFTGPPVMEHFEVL